jgi:hypothetical protein
LSPGKLIWPSLIFVGNAGAYKNGALELLCRLLASPSNIRLG